MNKIQHIIEEYTQAVVDKKIQPTTTIEMLQQLYDLISKEVIGAEERHLETRFSRCDYYEHREDDECTCGAYARNEHRDTQLEALNKLFGKE